MSNYLTFVGLREYGYAVMPQFEETLTSTIGIVIKKSIHNTWPCRITSGLVSKAYVAGSQAGA